MEGAKLHLRLAVLLTLTFVSILIITANLYNLQIINGESYLKESSRKIQRTTTVSASRGDILDRYGRTLVTNRLSYVVRFDLGVISGSKISNVQLNGTINELTALMLSKNLSWTDTLPVTAFPFAQVSEPTEQQMRRYNRYLEEMSVPGYTPEQLMDFLIQRFEIAPEYSEAQARLIAGVRYELELRLLFFDIPSYVFSEDADISLVMAIKEQGFPGVQVDCEPVRQYNTSYAAHILGHVGPIFEKEYEELKKQGYKLDSIVGKDGVEKSLEEWLRGIDGQLVEEINTEGKVTNVINTKPPQPGGNCVLTIDLRLQEVAERALDEHIHRLIREGNASWGGFDARGGAVAVVDVRNGEILALASYPTFNPSTFSADYKTLENDPLKPFYNRATMETYAPGSTFKMCTATAALETGTITPSTSIYDRHTYVYYKGYSPRCMGYHGSINVINALRVSCNYFFYDVGRRSGIDALEKYGALYGLGQPTGIELAEVSGLLAGSTERKERDLPWYEGETLAAAIGQSDNAFTPLQLANYVATVANGGTRYRTHILKTVKSYDYTQNLYDAPPEIMSQVGMSESTHNALTSGMRAAAKTGTAANVFGSYPIEVAAKTGSAQITNQRSDNGVFVAYAPYNNPEIAIAVIVERGGQGNRVAPIARDIFTAYFRQAGSVGAVIPEKELLR